MTSACRQHWRVQPDSVGSATYTHVVVELFDAAEPGRRVRAWRARPRPAPHGPSAPSSATSCVANSATSISSLLGTSANTRARFASRPCAVAAASGAARKAARWRARIAVDCAAAASRTRVRKQQQFACPAAQPPWRCAAPSTASRTPRPTRRARFRRSPCARPVLCHPQPAARHQIYSVRHGAGLEQQIARPAGRNGRRRPRASPESRAPRPGARLQLAQAIDGAAQFLRRARLFFLQSHG